ncbi:MAG: SulP family inorganic anion transporter, partial [Acidimicrobiia bacterium]|nr:SulP family inorganic anion transporter [Acidimicrobiia bacterium]
MTTSTSRWFPGLRIARDYRASWLSGDVAAGLTLTALLVPQGMAYAQLAGLPPVTGLYTTVLGLLAYAIFGPSRILVLGPDSALGPLIAAAIVPVVAASAESAVAVAGVLAVMMGFVCIGAGLARLGTVAELLSKPVRVGYLNGIAIVVLASQLPKLFGFSADSDSTLGELADFMG